MLKVVIEHIKSGKKIEKKFRPKHFGTRHLMEIIPADAENDTPCVVFEDNNDGSPVKAWNISVFDQNPSVFEDAVRFQEVDVSSGQPVIFWPHEGYRLTAEIIE